MLQITAYEETDIPPGMTCAEYRRLKMAGGAAPRRRRLPWPLSLLQR
jgi:hypothetical protein